MRTGKPGSGAEWLCFKAKDGTERPGHDVTLARPESVVSGWRVLRGPRARDRASHPPPIEIGSG